MFYGRFGILMPGIVVFVGLISACASTPEPQPSSQPSHDESAGHHPDAGGTSLDHKAPANHGHPAMPQESSTIMRSVADIHGGAGPFAVAGYRMGVVALEHLGLERGSFDVSVIHYTPEKVQFSCIADGLQAATGVSAGKLNLKLMVVEPDGLSTVVKNRATGESLRFELSDTFFERYLNTPRDLLMEAGANVAMAPAEQLFQVYTDEEVPISK